MQAVSRKIALDPSVDLEEYVDSTQGFSGADLQAFIYNAQLEAVHDIVEEDRDGPSTRTSEAEAYNGSFHVWKAGALHDSRAMAASERSVVSKQVSLTLGRAGATRADSLQVESLIRANAGAEGDGGNVKPVLARSQVRRARRSLEGQRLTCCPAHRKRTSSREESEQYQALSAGERASAAGNHVSSPRGGRTRV